MERFAFIRDAVVVFILEEPKIREVREINVAAPRENAGGNAISGGVEAVGEDGALVGFAVIIGVENQFKSFGILLVFSEINSFVALHHGDPILDGAGGEILIQPGIFAADIRDT